MSGWHQLYTGVTSRLRGRYPERSHALLEQVANGTGFRANRWADVVVMSLWPSRGLYFSGFEIKVSKSDFKREMDDPAKAEEIQSFCAEWWIVAPQGLLEAHEMPPTWGLLEVTEKLKCKVTKAAPTLDDVGEAVRVLSNGGQNYVIREMRQAAENFRIWAKHTEEDAATLEELLGRRKSEATE